MDPPLALIWNFGSHCGSLFQELNTKGLTIILTTHYLEEAEALCGRITMLKNGEIVALDRTDNLLTSATEKRLRL
jgi:ABC-2 type transport system ATP-binding protein